MHARWPALILLLLLAPSAAAYRDCFLGGRVCASYDWKPDDVYLDAQSDQGTFGAGRHGSGDFRGTNAYVFTSPAKVGAFDGTYMGHDQFIVTAEVAGLRLFHTQADGRATSYSGSWHCVSIGPAPTYARCGTGLP